MKKIFAVLFLFCIYNLCASRNDLCIPFKRTISLDGVAYSIDYWIKPGDDEFRSPVFVKLASQKHPYLSEYKDGYFQMITESNHCTSHIYTGEVFIIVLTEPELIITFDHTSGESQATLESFENLVREYLAKAFTISKIRKPAIQP
jgi:hypothetical protein